MKKRLIAAAVSTTMIATLFTGCGEDPARAELDSEGKPKKILAMVDGTVFTKENGQEEFIQRWEELTGIELEILQPDHDAYYDVMGQTFASGVENWPDVMILSPDYLAGYAQEGALWDMTEAWENSDLKKSGRVTNE